MAMVSKKWDNVTVEVDEDWLNRAKELVQYHGIINISPTMSALEKEMKLPRGDSRVSVLVVIAIREAGSNSTASSTKLLEGIISESLRQWSQKP